MSRIVPLAVLVVLCAVTAAGAATHVVEARPNNTFSPSSLVIAAGDTVTWRNTGGLHNVRADDGSFRCANGCDGSGTGNGSPSSSAWEFSLTFNDPGTISYDCEVHVNLGMVGTITVEAATTMPGTLSFTQATAQADEGDGTVTLTVRRQNGGDGAVSVGYSTSNGSATAGSDYSAASGTLNWSNGDTSNKTFNVTILDDGDEEDDETFNVVLANPTGGASLGSPTMVVVTIVDDDEAPTQQPGRVNFTASSYSADEGDGSARIRVERRGGSDGMVTVDADTSSGSADSGVDFIDFSGTLTWGNGETGVKFFDIPLVDDDVEESPETVNLMLSAPTGGVVLANPSAATLNITDNDAPPPPPPSSGDCMADDFTLCLNRDNRFKVQVDWATATDSGRGRAKDIGARDSGLFFFFGENNIEMLVKVLDGCRITDHFWVFYAATTNVEFTLTVVDTEADVTKQYKNKLGNPANAVTDTSAFATCP